MAADAACAAQRPPTMPLERSRLEELRSDAFAEDLEIDDEMLEWTEADARAFFETGGERRPPREA